MRFSLAKVGGIRKKTRWCRAASSGVFQGVFRPAARAPVKVWASPTLVWALEALSPCCRPRRRLVSLWAAVPGEVAEWSKATVLKTVDRASGPGVRIPPSPP